MGTIDVYLALGRSGRVMAHVLEPPGLGRSFPDRATLDAELPGAIAEHFAWLHARGHAPAARSPRAIRVAEETGVEGGFESGDDVGTFSPDLEPLTEADRARHLAIAAHAHEDLIAWASRVPAELLQREPRPGVRSLTANLRHVARAEIWYLTRIIDDPDVEGMPEAIERADRDVDATRDGVEQVHIAWNAFERFMRELGEERRARRYEPTWFCTVAGERWTARKVLRRCIEHCREHAWVMERTLRCVAKTC